MSTDTNVNTLIINTMTTAQFEALENPSNTELYFVEDEGIYADDTQVVHLNGAEQINGIKTFTNGAVFNNITAPTLNKSDKSDNVATTKFVHDVIESLLQRIESLEQQIATLTGE
jgi:hypothetical protein